MAADIEHMHGRRQTRQDRAQNYNPQDHIHTHTSKTRQGTADSRLRPRGAQRTMNIRVFDVEQIMAEIGAVATLLGMHTPRHRHIM